MSDAIQVYRPTGWGHEITMIAMRPGDIVPGSDYVLFADHAAALRERDERIAALEKTLSKIDMLAESSEMLDKIPAVTAKTLRPIIRAALEAK